MDILVRTFLWVLHASLTASIVGLILILILKLFNSFIGVRLQHALLLIIIVRLIIPVNIPSNINLFNILLGGYENKTLNVESNTNLAYDFLREGKVYLNDKQKYQTASKTSSLEKASNNEEKVKKENIFTYALNIASFIWLMGVFITTLFFLLVVWKFKRKTSNLKELKDLKITVLMEECKKKADINRNIPIYDCDSFKSPCILGILKPKIYIPKYEYSTNNYKHLSHILLHELIHYKRKDSIYNFMGMVALLIYWFNPLIWFLVKKMKLQREYACDAYVLEILGEEEVIEYGMTLINFSKLISSSRKVPQLAVFFETKNQIKRRIKMMKNFKKGSYKMSAAAVICCVLAGGVVFATGVTAKDMKSSTNVEAIMNNDLVKKENSKFLIDAPVKVYDNLKRVGEITGFKVKVPDYLPTNYELRSIHVIKVSDKDNFLKMSFGNQKDDGFNFQVSKVNMEECLKKIAENENKETLSTVPDTIKAQNQGKVEVSKEAMNLAGINGSNITIKSTLPGDYQTIGEFFVWQNEGMWYSIGYNMETKGSKEKGFTTGTPIDDVGKIVSSIKYVQDVKNVNYSIQKEVSTEIATLSIYDREDLKKAKELLGFDPKFPLNINKDITINGSAVGLSGDSDIKSEKLNYELNMWYNSKIGRISFTQGKSSKNYEAIKEKAHPIQIDGKQVFKSETSETSKANKQLKAYTYIWKENGFYCELFTLEGNGNPDEIAKEFVNSKPID